MKFYIQTEEVNFVHYELEAVDYDDALESVRAGNIDPKNIEHDSLTIIDAHEIEAIE